MSTEYKRARWWLSPDDDANRTLFGYSYAATVEQEIDLLSKGYVPCCDHRVKAMFPEDSTDHIAMHHGLIVGSWVCPKCGAVFVTGEKVKA
jgi:hypothetical protein